MNLQKPIRPPDSVSSLVFFTSIYCHHQIVTRSADHLSQISIISNPSSKLLHHYKMSFSPLLALPFEIRDLIWSFTAINGSWTRLGLTCKLFHEELQSHCQLPGRLKDLERMVIRVDPSYVQGTWLEVQCIWHTGRRYRHLTLPIQNMDDAMVGMLWDMGGGTPQHMDMHVVAPSQGHVWADFLVMFAKANDAMSLIKWILPPIYDWYTPQPDNPTLRVLFDSDGQASSKRRKSFWECRCVKGFNHGRLPSRGNAVELPCLYQYFANIVANQFWSEPRFVFSQPLTVGHFSTSNNSDDDPDALIDDRPGIPLSQIVPTIGVNHFALYRLLDTNLATRGAPQGGSLDILWQHWYKTCQLSPDNFLSDHSSFGKSRHWWEFIAEHDFIA